MATDVDGPRMYRVWREPDDGCPRVDEEVAAPGAAEAIRIVKARNPEIPAGGWTASPVQGGLIGKWKPIPADGPLRLANRDDVYRPLRWLPVAIIAVGDLAAFRLGAQGCLVRFKDPTIRYTAGRPEGAFFLRQFTAADRDLAIRHATRIAERPPELIADRGEYILTTRGPIQLAGVQFADGGKNPRVPDGVLAEIRAHFKATFAPARDSEGNRYGD